MKPVLVSFSAVLLISCSTADRPLVSKIPSDRREFEIANVDYSAREASATITFSSSFGIFAFDLDPGRRKLKRLTLIVNNQRYCEGLSFQDKAGHWTDLLHVKGVLVFQEGNNLVIEIVPPAVDLLKDGGRVQYVNQYR